MAYSLEEYYQVNIANEKKYDKDQRLPTGAIIKISNGKYYLIGDVARTSPTNTIPSWGSAGCGCCSETWVEPFEIVGYVDILGLET